MAQYGTQVQLALGNIRGCNLHLCGHRNRICLPEGL